MICGPVLDWSPLEDPGGTAVWPSARNILLAHDLWTAFRHITMGFIYCMVWCHWWYIALSYCNVCTFWKVTFHSNPLLPISHYSNTITSNFVSLSMRVLHWWNCPWKNMLSIWHPVLAIFQGCSKCPLVTRRVIPPRCLVFVGLVPYLWPCSSKVSATCGTRGIWGFEGGCLRCLCC